MEKLGSCQDKGDEERNDKAWNREQKHSGIDRTHANVQSLDENAMDESNECGTSRGA